MDHHHHHEPPQPPPPPPPSPCIGATAHLEAGEQGALELVVSMNFTVVEESHGTNEAGPGAVAHAEGHVLLESSPSELAQLELIYQPLGPPASKDPPTAEELAKVLRSIAKSTKG